MMNKGFLVGIFLVFILFFSMSFVVAEWTENLNENLLGYWNFDTDGSDLTGNGHDCIGNATHTSRGILGDGSYYFNQMFLDCPGLSSNLTNNFTWSFWVNSTTSGDFFNIMVMSNNENPTYPSGMEIHIGQWGTDVVGFRIFPSGGDIDGSNSPHAQTNAGRWSHLVITYDGNYGRIYQNGTNIKNISGSGTLNYTGNPNLTIGRLMPPNYYYAPGIDIDEVGIWNRALNSSEINDLWNNGNGITYSSSNQSSQNETNQSSTNETGFWNLTGTNLYPSSLDYFVGIGTATPRVALDVMGVIYGGDGKLQFGTPDPQGRSQIWNFLPHNILRLGSSTADGDPQDIISEGIVVYGNNSRDDVMSSINYGWARIKPNRFALHNGINDTQSDYFRVDPNGLYLKDDSHMKTFEITRESGLVNTETGYSVDSEAGITDNSSFWMCEDSACSTTCQVDIRGGIIIGCD